jgi:RNA polymerase-binding transcription factor
MTQPELDKYRTRLRDKLAELTNGSQDRGALAVDPVADEMDQTQGSQERDMAVQVCNLDTRLLGDLRSALIRIERGTFGICADCELDISPKRLAAVPWAESCIVCQEAADNAENGMGQRWYAAEESFENAA